MARKAHQPQHSKALACAAALQVAKLRAKEAAAQDGALVAR
jgi:hypothetical protein